MELNFNLIDLLSKDWKLVIFWLPFVFGAFAWFRLFMRLSNINNPVVFLSASSLALLGLATSIVTLLAEAFGLPVSYKVILAGFVVLSALTGSYLFWLQHLSSNFAQSINDETVLNAQEQELRQDNLNSSQSNPSNLEFMVSNISSWAGFIAMITLVGAWLGQLLGYPFPALLNAFALTLVSIYIGGKTYLNYISMTRE
ncbi:hypothetical protein [Nostoc sp. UIC 10630]|uniref:hypothetical protein n=1 Tax=Nostoc sp. UIC 10630 TaxID=2100146 RepID=UPI0013D056E2|nr:hypothetical protein [Nostoc sp. UIC 10630]NEU82098.1 hypothetical protein [Nostoc sp. UIC 10630]